jgi:hypothetical protein
MDRVSRDVRLTTGCKAWLLGVIALRSDDFGRRVWGTQARMGIALGRSERSVRRYVDGSGSSRTPTGSPYRRKTRLYS